MEQIDAGTAVKILVAAAPSGTAEPMMEAMRFLLEAARRGRIGIRAFRGANPEHEPISTFVLSDLEINFLARASRGIPMVRGHRPPEAREVAAPARARSTGCQGNLATRRRAPRPLV
jgi:hypothetical protein